MLPLVTNRLHPVRYMHGRKARPSVWRRTMDISLGGVTYKDVTVSKDKYGDGSLALILEDGERIAVVSVWLEEHPADGCIWVKNYSENSGIQEEMVSLGLLELTGRVAQAGFVTVQEARVLA